MEMWYYNNLVEYSPGKTYKFVEMTMINDRVVNLGFFLNLFFSILISLLI
jgi:hypothetical protein